ncbi:hypothetical protein [Klebsiella pneumoniae]|uniref:hypothetical protein n=1 Tax=Klebsiella pneumoniae TaxID=573 RepID=UPI0030BF3D6F
MSKLLDRFRYFKQKGETFANGHGQVYNNNRDWEDSYRQRWQFDKIVRSTHGVNCTGSCSWKSSGPTAVFRVMNWAPAMR